MESQGDRLNEYKKIKAGIQYCTKQPDYIICMKGAPVKFQNNEFFGIDVVYSSHEIPGIKYLPGWKSENDECSEEFLEGYKRIGQIINNQRNKHEKII